MLINNFYIVILYLAVFGAFSFVYVKHALQMFQQNHYELYRYSKWLFSRNNLKISVTFIYIILVLLIGTLFRKHADLPCLLITVCFTIYQLIKENSRTYIKDLVVTARVKRQIVVFVLLMTLSIWCLMHFMKADLIGIFVLILSYLLIYPMALLTMPMEYLIKKHYENEARSILNGMDDLIKIGITGSYGKTSTKNIINDIISYDRYTLMTPASYNTPMGITRTIREQLKPIHEVFLCEMGADKVGDISYLMDFVRPQYGVVTSIGKQHLNTFHDLDNIIFEKMQEVELLPLDGVAFLNNDNEYIRNYRINNRCKVVRVATEGNEADYVAKDLKYSKDGSAFTVQIDGRNYKFTTSLLGRHNITNILLGIAIARELGMDIRTIQKNVSNVKQVEHRLQVKKISNFTFIDDAFNANPEGSKNALDVLAMMPGKRIIVTPGMIDLGSAQSEINQEFGRSMLEKADEVILVGEKQTEPILAGLKEVSFPMEHVRVFKTINEALAYVYQHFSSADTILLENDLPDAFNV